MNAPRQLPRKKKAPDSGSESRCIYCSHELTTEEERKRGSCDDTAACALSWRASLDGKS